MRTALLFSLLVVTLLSGARAEVPATDLPHWLSGHWCTLDGDGRGDEFWLPEGGGMMVGLSRSVTPGQKTQFEFLRIESINGTPTYLAQPQGGAAIAFKREDGGEHWIRFGNPAHDFPQHIEYCRQGQSLQAEIAGPDGKDGTLRIPFAFRRCADAD